MPAMVDRRRLLPAALAVSLLAAEAAARDSTASHVETLRRQQQRLEHLDFSVREAELVKRLCGLRPSSPECAAQPPPPPAAVAPAESASSSPPGETYRVLEIFGSNRRMTAVLSSPGRSRVSVRQGSRLAGGLRVSAVRHDGVVLVEGDRRHELLLGD